MSRRKTQMPSVKSVLGIRPTDKPPPPQSSSPALPLPYVCSIIRLYLA